MRLRQIFGALVLAARLSGQDATQSLQVTAVRFWSLSDVTRVAIETNGEFDYKSDRLQNPDRLFFDLIGARPHLGSKGIVIKQVGDKFLKRVRIAENVPGVTRVVLDLENDVEYSTSQLASPDRLMIELRRSKPPKVVAPPKLNTYSVPLVTPPGSSLRRLTADNPLVLKPRLVDPPSPQPQPIMPRLVEFRVDKFAPPPVPTAMAARGTASDGSRSLTRALGLKVNRVVIDPGHGGHDQGTTGEKGLVEKDLVLDVALRLGKLIEEKMNSEVVFTRADDTFIPLQERTEIANRKKADLFISIHANSSPVPRVAGIETYYLNFTSSSDAMDVATRENASSDKSVYELQSLVQTIAKHDKVEESRSLALDVQTALQAFELRNNPAAKDRGVRQAPFVVLIGAQMPSILAEIGFLSNARDENLLAKPEYRQRLAEALYRGVSKYRQTLSHVDVSRAASSTILVGKSEEPVK